MESEVVNRKVAVGACRPHPKNYNRHSQEQIGDLRASLRQFGQVRSIVVQAEGEGFVLVAGEGLWRAAQLEGLKKLRADVIPADWDQVRVVAYMAADNELARQADPDEMQLAALVAEIEREAGEEMARLAAGAEARLAELMALAEEAITGFETVEKEQARLTLAERFIVPPFSVLDARQGYWQERKRAWIALGIQGELGRGESAAPGGSLRPAASLGPNGKTVRGDGKGRPIAERE